MTQHEYEQYMKELNEKLHAELSPIHNEMEELIKHIMGLKKSVGEFSMDLYYNDTADESKAFVVRLKFPNGLKVHFRRQSFMKGLAEAFEYLLK